MLCSRLQRQSGNPEVLGLSPPGGEKLAKLLVVQWKWLFFLVRWQGFIKWSNGEFCPKKYAIFQPFCCIFESKIKIWKKRICKLGKLHEINQQIMIILLIGNGAHTEATLSVCLILDKTDKLLKFYSCKCLICFWTVPLILKSKTRSVNYTRLKQVFTSGHIL